MKKGYLILENGEIFEGFRFGAEKDTVGELVFTTGMVGYTESLTDPSYFGQIVTSTFPLVGNYGINPEDYEGKPALFGYVVREKCDHPSNFRSRKTLDGFLSENGIPGLFGVDTRQITRIIRENGVMNAAIVSDKNADLALLRSYSVKNAAMSVTCEKPAMLEAEKARRKVVLLDFGAKKSIAENLIKRGCTVIKVPCTATCEEILSYSPDGVLISNGPGDPSENTQAIGEIKKLIGKVPIFGICLGHQLLALAFGGKTEKLKFGHRGANQPVFSISDGKTYITSQNHGYTVIPETLAGTGEVSFINANDGSCEGMDYPGYNCFSVQFHPEACAGPRDTGYLFDEFVKKTGGK